MWMEAIWRDEHDWRNAEPGRADRYCGSRSRPDYGTADETIWNRAISLHRVAEPAGVEILVQGRRAEHQTAPGLRAGRKPGTRVHSADRRGTKRLQTIPRAGRWRNSSRPLRNRRYGLRGVRSCGGRSETAPGRYGNSSRNEMDFARYA